MACEVAGDDEYIVISELSDESGVDEKSVCASSVADTCEKQTLSSSSCNEKKNSDDAKNECHLPVQETGTAYQSTNEANVNSSSSCGLQNPKTCKNCGHVGSEESFCGNSKNYCSLKCAELFRFPSGTQSSVAPTQSLQVNSPVPVQSSLSNTGSKSVKSCGIVPVSAAKHVSGNRPLDWKEYVVREGATVAPVTCFKHCPFSQNFSHSLLVGIKLEVINTDTEITEYPVYWMATVVDVAGLSC